MARTIEQIYQGIVAYYTNRRTAAGLVPDDPLQWSATNLKKLFFTVAAYVSWVLENLFDVHTADTNAALRERKSPTRQWYKNLVLGYQHGFPVIDETDRFDNTGYTLQQIEASKLVKYCAVIKQVLTTGRVKLFIKVAGSNGNDLVQLPTPVVAGLTAYLDGDNVLPAGDNWEIVARNYDKIKMKWRIHYDARIISATGARLDGTANEPARDAINDFLKTGMPFSGIYEPIKHQDAVQLVPGVKLPEILAVATQNGLFPFQAVAAQYIPDSGWIRFDQQTDLEIIYVPYKDE